MNKTETMDILDILKTHFNNYFKGLNSKQEELYCLSLYAMFKDFDKSEVINAVINSLSGESYGQPNLALIKKNLTKEIHLDCEKLWSIAYKNCRADMRYAIDNWEKLDESLKQYITPELLYEIGWSTNDEQPFIKQRVFKEWQTKTDYLNEQKLLGNSTDLSLLGIEFKGGI